MALDYSSGAEADLANLDATDPEAHDLILVFLEEADVDQKLIDRFTTRGDGTLGKWHFNIKQWEATRGVANLYRIRVLDSPATDYRVVYGYDWLQRRICVLAIAHKELFNYEPSSDLGGRILKDWCEYTGGRKT